MSETLSAWKKRLGCSECDSFSYGRHYDHRTVLGAWRYKIQEKRREIPRRLKWFAAAWLRRIACWIMDEKWYISDCWAGVPGNRAAELKQQIFEGMVIACHDADEIAELGQQEQRLDELAQIAGQSWGHIYPPQPQPAAELTAKRNG